MLCNDCPRPATYLVRLVKLRSFGFRWLSSVVGAEDALQEPPKVWDVLSTHFHILMVAPLRPIWSSWPLCERVQVLSGLYIHHKIPSPLLRAKGSIH